MSLTLGEKLRQAREERGISISEVAEQTRIAPLYIESIENDDYKPLPGGIFNKGFVKSYAKYVGVDEQEALADYARLIAEKEGPNAGEEPKTYRPEVLTDERTSGSRLSTIVFAVIILGLMTWGILTLVRYVQDNPSSPTASNNTNTAANNNANAGTATPAPTPIVANEIKFEFKPTRDTINVTYWADGKMASRDVKPGDSVSLNPQQSLKVSYYRGFTPDKVQITLNGKQISAPNPPAKGNVIFEINKENIAQILQSGQISAGGSADANTNSAVSR